MAQYLSSETIRAAVERLSTCAANSTLTDFLIFRRALKNSSPATKAATQVVTGTQSEPFRRAIEEMTSCATTGMNWSGQPHYSPFASHRDNGRGFKSAKYPSNGPSDTVGGWQSRGNTPLKLVPDSKPKAYTFVNRSEDELRAFFIKKGDDVERPLLADAAVWWFRFADVSKRFSASPSKKELSDAFIADLGLTSVERKAFFEPKSDVEESLTLAFDSSPAAPSTYLPTGPVGPALPEKKKANGTSALPVDLDGKISQVIQYISAAGFSFEPWQVAAFITAVRTKPFVILAGVSGTGKTKLPRLVAEATGAESHNVPVRPDWTDSSDLLGYERVDGTFIPGALLRVARDAIAHPTKQHFFLLDEMNIARVEYYLAEVLSHIEERFSSTDADGFRSRALLPHARDAEWASVYLPPNLCLVGSVNMDETTHGFSRKVLDRSFVIEFSDIDLTKVGTTEEKAPTSWTVDEWRQGHLSLSTHPENESDPVKAVVDALIAVNEALTPVQLQVGYRVRDEVALYCLNARSCASSFAMSGEGNVDPLDLAVAMKVLPRLQGSGAMLQRALEQLRDWASGKSPTGAEKRSFPFCEERLLLMLQRLSSTGFTSYWL
jgi:hypothetical protein